MSACDALETLWRDLGLARDALAAVSLTGAEPALPSSFAVGIAARASIAAAALAAAEIWRLRTGRLQSVAVDITDAVLECTGWFTLDGKMPSAWEKLSGLYPCGAAAADPGWVRLHANFDHHRDGALRALGLTPGGAVERADVERALRGWTAGAFEEAAMAAGGVVAALRTFAEWDAHPQGAAVASLPLVAVDRLGDAEPRRWTGGRGRPSAPLEGLRVLDLTRILAGPVCGRTLAGYGAEVLLVNGPGLPNIPAIADTSRGKRSAHLDLTSASGRDALADLIRDADVVVEGYRPGALAASGFAPQRLAELHPGVICVSLSAYGHAGPWAGRRGFDSIVQTVAGFNHAEAQALGEMRPKALPVPILDYASGFLMAFAAQAALLKQARHGGSWHVRVALARTAHWLRGLGRVDGAAVPRLDPRQRLQRYESGFGELMALPHAARLDETPAQWRRPSMPPGSHPPRWET